MASERLPEKPIETLDDFKKLVLGWGPRVYKNDKEQLLEKLMVHPGFKADRDYAEALIEMIDQLGYLRVPSK